MIIQKCCYNNDNWVLQWRIHWFHKFNITFNNFFNIFRDSYLMELLISNFKRATKLYFMHYSCECGHYFVHHFLLLFILFIIFYFVHYFVHHYFVHHFFWSSFSTYLFEKLIFRLFTFSVFSASSVFRFHFHKFITFVWSLFVKMSGTL